MDADSVGDVLHLFSKRREVFECLCDEQFDKQAVQKRIDASRPTVDRAFRELEAAGILDSTGTAYDLTNFGALCCAEFERVTGTLGTLTAMADLLAHLPREADFDLRMLEGAAVHYAEDHAPHEPLMEVLDVAVAASEIAGYSSVITPHYVDAFHSLLVEEGTPARLVFSEGVVETGMENYPERFGEIVDAPNATVYETEHDYTYGAIVGDGRVAVPVGDDRDRLLGVVTNDTVDAVAWVTAFLDDVIASDRTREL
ncbi:helix-turn-helix transcriptional regulator [Halorientalis halophila]|uniref:helix-turn-helix transcriptional regulator n=1 Tax=Halorientalis halophila TaxID=3108499 RepID=UPI0030087EB3